MLRHLHIRNLAIIDTLSLDFEPGFTVLTGETGAGKSILIDALGLLLGMRAESSLVRAGADKAEIAGEFSLDDAPAARAWLEERELAGEGHCAVRRIVYAEGRTRAFVNGSPVTAGDLRSLGECLVEIFGQNESQSLLRGEVQRALLDQHGRLDALLAPVAAAAGEVRALDLQIDALAAQQGQDPAQADYLRFQVAELDALGLAAGELEQLDAEYKLLVNAGRLIEEGEAAQSLLYGGDQSAYDQLAAVLATLRGLAPLDAQFGEPLALVESAQAQVREAADALRRRLERLELDPQRLAELEKRLAAIHELARKHRVRDDELPGKLAQLRASLEGLEGAAGRLQGLQQARGATLQRYRSAAAVLSAARSAAAAALSAEVTARVRELGMPNAEFRAAVEPAGRAQPAAQGDDTVRYDFSANPGQPPRPLARVASGGELSRISLALQVSLHGASLQHGDAAATMIFDEVDAGIGGGTAETVGRQLRALGASRQVLCVTHLAQVAAQGQQHFAIRKEVREQATFTRVDDLDPAGRVEEIGRMLRGRDLSAATQALARDLLEQAAR
ncbi:MAG: DNA repair protein RecN [Nevskia sp.]|nr:DNA repair protein RecN [Nevskia sp.]